MPSLQVNECQFFCFEVLTSSTPDNCLYHYQTLLTGLIAVAAAFFSLRLLHHQTKQTQEHHEENIAEARRQHLDERRRRSRAARSVLPEALSSLVSYADQSISYWVQLRSAVSSEGRSSVPESDELTSVPQYSADDIVKVQESIEFADEDVAHGLSDVLGWLQIQNVRLGASLERSTRVGRSHIIRGPTSSDANQGIYDSAKLMAIAESFFEYARRETDSAPDPIDRPAVRSALRRAFIDEETDPDVYRLLNIEFGLPPDLQDNGNA